MRLLTCSQLFKNCRNFVGLNSWLQCSEILIDNKPIPDDLDHLLALNAFINRLPKVYRIKIKLRGEWIEAIGNGDTTTYAHTQNNSKEFLKVLIELKQLVSLANRTESHFSALDPAEKYYHSLYSDIPAFIEKAKKIKHPNFKPSLHKYAQSHGEMGAFMVFIISVMDSPKLAQKLHDLKCPIYADLVIIYEFISDLILNFGEDIFEKNFEHVSNVPLEYHCINLETYKPINDLNGRIKEGVYIVNKELQAAAHIQGSDLFI